MSASPESFSRTRLKAGLGHSSADLEAGEAPDHDVLARVRRDLGAQLARRSCRRACPRSRASGRAGRRPRATSCSRPSTIFSWTFSGLPSAAACSRSTRSSASLASSSHLVLGDVAAGWRRRCAWPPRGRTPGTARCAPRSRSRSRPPPARRSCRRRGCSSRPRPRGRALAALGGRGLALHAQDLDRLVDVAARLPAGRPCSPSSPRRCARAGLFTSWAEMAMLIRTPRQDRTCGARAGPGAAAASGRVPLGVAGSSGEKPASSASRRARSSASRRSCSSASRSAFSSASLRSASSRSRRAASSSARNCGGALARHVGDALDDHLAGADRVVVARDHEVDGIRVAVGVHQADDRDLEALGLAHADVLGLEVHHEHRVRRALHVGHAAEVGLELVALGHRGDALAHRQQLHRAGLGPVAQLVQAPDALGDGLEVGQQAAQPALVDVRHARTRRRPP